MKVRTVMKTAMHLVMCSILVFAVAFLGGCKGKAGEAGAPGANGTSVALNDCDNCHHLNSLAVNDFNETFIDGLAGSNVAISSGTSTVISFNSTKLPAGETAQSFVWVRTNGQAATVSSPTASVTLITLPTIADYKSELVRHVKGLEIRSLDGTLISDRTQIVPVNPLNLEEASSATFKLRVATTSGKFYFGLVTVTDQDGQAAVEGFAAVGTGIRNVPVGVPVLIHTKSQPTFTWTVTGPSGAVTVDGANTQLPSFVPTAPGQYTATETSVVPNQTINIFAGTWNGAITGISNLRPTSDECTVCHDGQTAPDKFTPWMNTRHAEIFTQNLNAGGHYGESCLPCHTVGFDKDPLAVNNGFDDQANYAAFVADPAYFSASADDTRYTKMQSQYPDLFKLTNIQCENCHGPHNGSTLHNNGTLDPERISLSADVCGACHGEPLRHARFQQWEDSGHGSYELAAEEGTSANCAGCHTAQGFMVLLPRLQSGIPLRTIPAASITWTADTVLPQTCSVCHDPHDQGTTSGKPNTAKVRVEDNTPKLPGGFVATGVGRGAICIICHNSRNGTPSTTNEPGFNITPFNQDAFLHMDGDPVFGNLTRYAGPHEANQGDVLMGYNAYFVGFANPTNSQYRSPHSQIIGACVNCHMEQTPPPALLSYNLAGTNHSFKVSLNICSNCHPVNQSLGPMLQEKVKSTLEALEKSIGDKIISRNTGTPIGSVRDLGERGLINVIFSDATNTTNAVTEINVGNIP